MVMIITSSFKMRVASFRFSHGHLQLSSVRCTLYHLHGESF